MLSFAIETEEADQLFYQDLAGAVDEGPANDLIQDLAGQAKKNVKKMRRARQENVTEMILEPINDFDSDLFSVERTNDGSTDKMAIEKAIQVETTAENFYSQASEKIKNQSEISRLFKKSARKRADNIKRLQSL